MNEIYICFTAVYYEIMFLSLLMKIMKYDYELMKIMKNKYEKIVNSAVYEIYNFFLIVQYE